jgi:DNA-binding SARP family transcriptional activator
VRFAVLGPLNVVTPGLSEDLATPRAPKIRAVLGTLLIRANEVVSVNTLIDELWHDDPPRTALPTLQVYVSQLRKLLHRVDANAGRASLATRSPGYLLRLDPGQLDLAEFEDLHTRSGAAMRRQDYALAAELQHRALALWRGPLLSDTPHGAILGSAAVRLAELRIAALERRIRADLCLGHHHDLVGELQELAADFPTREEIHAHLMVALYRTGRRADALRVFERLRHTLAEELGIEPGHPLQRLRQRIRTGDPGLLRPAGLAPPSQPMPAPARSSPTSPHAQRLQRSFTSL